MKIATRLKFNSLLLAVMMLIIVVLFALAFRVQRAAHERSVIFDEIMKASYELNSLSNRYLRYPGERPKEQWLLTYDSLARNLNSNFLERHAPRVVLARMKQNLADMRGLFRALVTADESRGKTNRKQSDPAFEQYRAQVSDLIIKRSRDLTLDAARLTAMADRVVVDTNRKIAWLLPLAGLLLTITTVWLSLRIGTSIAAGIERLRTGAAAVGAGNLDYRIGLASSDELGQFSRTFDAMTAGLQEITVSRDELTQEIAERRRSEDELKHSKHELERYSAQLETILNYITDGLVVADLEGRLFRWNPAAVAMHGFTSEAEGRRLLPEFTALFELSTEQEGVLPLERWPLARVLAGETLHDWEVRIRRPATGWQRVFSYGGTLARDGEGRPLLAVIIVSDVTERKRRDEEFRKLSRQNELILENAGEGIFGLDLEGKVTFVNAVAAHLLGYAPEELQGSHSHTTWHSRRPDGSDYPSKDCPIYAAYNEGTIHSGEEFFWRKDGTGFFVDFTSRPLYEQDRISGAVVVYRDITARKQAEEELRLVLADLERSNRELEQFAYVASHDLQEPLRMVASYVQLLERKYRGQLDEKADRYIFFAVDGVQRMQKLIDGLLAYSRVARGAKFTMINAGEALGEAILNLSVAIRESRAVITRDQLPEVTADETQLSQVFQNLIANAIKFGKPGIQPVIHVSAQRAAAEWVFSVRDNGIGIEPQYHGKIFQIFQRLHTREQYPGTGIGLSLCKRIVERHGGRIWVDSTPGIGTAFFFTIPFKAKQRPALAA
ncbi:MAG: hypothetical protein A2010_18110 [Nitrospirae bacterium GWD2_57_9]|nr:MAG: hypothetical protein A2010_18110 [Nitrospirae bacterium GWD2_57_9]